MFGSLSKDVGGFQGVKGVEIERSLEMKQNYETPGAER